MRHGRKRTPGNSISEYVLPTVLVLLAGGLILSISGLNSLLGGFFREASGKTTANMQGTTLKDDMAPIIGATGNGAGAFTQPFALAAIQGTTIETVGNEGNEKLSFALTDATGKVLATTEEELDELCKSLLCVRVETGEAPMRKGERYPLRSLDEDNAPEVLINGKPVFDMIKSYYYCDESVSMPYHCSDFLNVDPFPGASRTGYVCDGTGIEDANHCVAMVCDAEGNCEDPPGWDE